MTDVLAVGAFVGDFVRSSLDVYFTGSHYATLDFETISSIAIFSYGHSGGNRAVTGGRGTSGGGISPREI